MALAQATTAVTVATHIQPLEVPARAGDAELFEGGPSSADGRPGSSSRRAAKKPSRRGDDIAVRPRVWSRPPEAITAETIAALESELRRSGGHPLLDGAGESLDEVESPAEEETYAGFLMKRSGAFSKTKQRFFVLRGGTLLWYASEAAQDSAPTGYVNIARCTLTPETLPTSLTLKGPVKEYLLTCSDSAERAGWVRALQRHWDRPPLSEVERLGVEPPTKEAKKSALSSLALRAEKKIVSRAVTSDVGKKLLREYCLPETFVLLTALRGLIGKDADPKTGRRLEDTILRFAVKVVLLYHHARLRPSDFDSVVVIADALCVDVVRKYDSLRRGPNDPLDANHTRLSARVVKCETELVQLLEPHVSPKNIAALREVTGYLANATTLGRITSEPALQPELTVMVQALRTMYKLPPSPSPSKSSMHCGEDMRSLKVSDETPSPAAGSGDVRSPPAKTPSKSPMFSKSPKGQVGKQ